MIVKTMMLYNIHIECDLVCVNPMMFHIATVERVQCCNLTADRLASCESTSRATTASSKSAY